MNMNVAMVPGLAMLAVSAFVGYSVIFVPTQKKVEYIQQQIVTEKENRRAQENMMGLVEELAQLRTALAESDDPSWIANEVVTHAQETGVQFSSVAQMDPKKINGYTHLSVQFDFSATFHELGQLVDLIERSPKFIWLERLDMESPEEGEEQSTGQIVFSAIYVPPVTDTLKSGGKLN